MGRRYSLAELYELPDPPRAERRIYSLQELYGLPEREAQPNVGGLPTDASQMDYAIQSMQAAGQPPPQHHPQTPEGFAQLREMANRQMMEPAKTPDSRFGDALKPAFGGHNPLAETWDRVIEPFVPGIPDTSDPAKQAWLDQRGGRERAGDAASFAASLPVRMATRGQYGAGDLASGLGFEEAGQSLSQAERDFATANEKQLGAVQLVGEGVLGGTGASMAPLAPRNPPRPRFEDTPSPHGPAPQMASMPDSGAARARQHVRDVDALGIPRFPPAIAQAARGSEGAGVFTRMVQGIPVVGRRIERRNKEFVDGSGRAIDEIAGRYSRTGNPEAAGGVARGYFDRFRNERTIDKDDIASLPDEQIARLATQPPRDIGSLKTATDARYERAWRNIPEEYRHGAGFKDEARLMGQMPTTRGVLRSIHDSNVRMMNRQRAAAAAEGVKRRKDAPPDVLATRQGGMLEQAIPFKDGILGQSVRAILDGNWSGSLQTMRDIRSAIRRANSRKADNEGNVLDKAYLARLNAAISRDMTGLIKRMSDDFRASGDVAMANRILRAKTEMDAADRFTASYAKAMDDLRGITGATRDAEVLSKIIGAAQAGSRANSNMLLRVRQMAPDQVLDAIASGVINAIGRPTGQASGAIQEAGFSIGKAVSEWNNMSPRARGLMFGHRPQLLSELNRFFRVAQGMADFEKMANTSRSGSHAIASAILFAPATLLASWDTLLLTGATSVGAAYWLTSPAYVRWLTRSMNVQKAIATGNMSKVTAQRTTKGLGKALARLIKNDRSLDPINANSILKVIGATSGEPSAPQTNDRFSPPMRLGGPKPQDRPPVDPKALEEFLNFIARKPANGAFDRTAPVPGDPPPPPAEMRSHTPSPSESAAFRARQLGEMLGMPTSQAEQFGGGIGGAASLLTPFDDVSGAVESGSASDAALAGFSLIPGFRGGKKAAEAALPGLRKEVQKLMSQYRALTGQSRALPAGFEPAEKQVEGLNELKGWLTKEIETARAARPQSLTSVPVTSSPEMEKLLRIIRNNPSVQAVPGRQGFPTKAQQEQLAREFFRGGGQLPAAPWGRNAADDVRHALAEAHARGKAVSADARKAASDAALKADRAAEEVETFERLASIAEGRGHRIAELEEHLERARKDASFWQAQYQKIKKQHFGD